MTGCMLWSSKRQKPIIGLPEQQWSGMWLTCGPWTRGGHLTLGGAFKGYPGVAGMYILKAGSYEEAEALCQAEPLVLEGFASYELRALQVASSENNYLLS